MNKIITRFFLLITLFAQAHVNMSAASEIPIHIKITETKEDDTTTKKEKDVYHVSIKPYEKKVITNNPKIECTLIDKTKKMTPECKQEFENIGIIPLDIYLKNNTPNQISINQDFYFENKLEIPTQKAITTLEEKLLHKKRAAYTIATLFPIMATIPAGVLGYFLAPSGMKVAKIGFEILKKTPAVFSKIFSLPFVIPTSFTAGLFLTLKYMTPNKLIKLYEKIFLQNYANNSLVNYFIPIMTLRTIQNALDIVEKIKNEKTNQEQITIQPSQTFKTTIFVRNKERNDIYHDTIIPELKYT